MAGVTTQPIKRKFVALAGINFETKKHRLRIEAGAELPADIPQTDLEDLIEIRAIKVKEEGGLSK